MRLDDVGHVDQLIVLGIEREYLRRVILKQVGDFSLVIADTLFRRLGAPPWQYVGEPASRPDPLIRATPSAWLAASCGSSHAWPQLPVGLGSVERH
jgi:hypothetical protein